MGIIKSILVGMFDHAMDLNKQNILLSLEKNPDALILDLGCDDGSWTMRLSDSAGTKNVFGIDIVPERVESAKKKGVQVSLGDLNESFPWKDGAFDVVHANQVIEHIGNLDLFVSEIWRVLKPGGYAVISTENASSWHNVFAAIMGWQIFSLSNVSSRRLGVGNPLALHRGNPLELSSWTHKTIFNYCGLLEFFTAHGFKDISVKGAGYYPLPAFTGKYDPRHAHFLTLKARK